MHHDEIHIDVDLVTALVATQYRPAASERAGDRRPDQRGDRLGRGGAGIGDPAADVIAAWSVFGRTGQDVFRECLQVDDGTWARPRGYALHQAAAIIPYYAETNPGFVALEKRTVERVLTDRSESARVRTG